MLPLALSAAVLAFGGLAHAANRDVSQYLEKAGAVATADLAAAGIDTAPGLKIRARVSSDGRLSATEVVTSSGSAATDQQAVRVLRRLRVPAPPNVLIGADVNIAIGGAPIQQAKVP